MQCFNRNKRLVLFISYSVTLSSSSAFSSPVLFLQNLHHKMFCHEAVTEKISQILI